jgi:hypothetical protein
MKKLIIPGVIAVVVIIVVGISLSGGESAVIYTKPHLYDSDYLKEIKIHENEILSGYKLIDTVNRVYSIPIDSAIEKFVSENN